MTRKQKRHLIIQWLRHACRVVVLLVMFGTIYLSLYAHYRAAKAIDDEQFLTGTRGVILKSIHHGVEKLDDPQPVLDSFKGTIWSLRFAGLDLTDPLAAAETVAASRNIHWPLMASILIPVVLALALGRVFCSWMCPAGLLFELTDRLRALLGIAEIKPGQVNFSHRNKYVFLSVGLIFTAIFSLPILGHIYPPAVISRLAHAWVYGTAMTGAIIIIALMVAFEVAVSPRWWCRTMCPGGALFGLLGWIRPVRIKLDAHRCTGCRDCIAVCPMGLDPVKQSYGVECDNCAMCLKSCGEDALIYSIGLPGRKRAFINQGNKHHAPEPTPARNRKQAATVAAATFVMTLFLAAPVSAHHILGLPHYSYKENYPQVPTLEYPATTGPYDVLMTSYPGIPTPGESANVAFYIKDRVKDEPYGARITVRVLQTSTFGRNKEILAATTIQPLDKTHKISVNFPTDGEYIVELSMEVEGATEVIPFLMVAGEPTATASILTALGAGLVVFIVIVRAVKIKRDRRLGGSTVNEPANHGN